MLHDTHLFSLIHSTSILHLGSLHPWICTCWTRILSLKYDFYINRTNGDEEGIGRTRTYKWILQWEKQTKNDVGADGFYRQKNLFCFRINDARKERQAMQINCIFILVCIILWDNTSSATNKKNTFCPSFVKWSFSWTSSSIFRIILVYICMHSLVKISSIFLLGILRGILLCKRSGFQTLALSQFFNTPDFHCLNLGREWNVHE